MIAKAAVVAGTAHAGDIAASPTPSPTPGGGAASTGWSWDAAAHEAICGRVAEDAVALVHPRAPRCGRAARAAREWALTFAPPGRRGAAHPLGCVELRFPSLDAALAYARAQGLRVEVCGAAAAHRPLAATFGATPLEPPPRALWWALDGRAALPDDLLMQEESAGRGATAAAPPGQGDADLAEAVLLDPAAVFAAPMDVAAHPRLTPAQKREILARWEWDARLIEAARAEGMPADAGEPSRLKEVLAARGALEAAVAWPPLLQASAACAAPPRPASTPPAEPPARTFAAMWGAHAVPSTAPDGVADIGLVESKQPAPMRSQPV